MDKLVISNRLRATLARHGIETLEQAAQHSRAYWESKPGISHQGIRELRGILRSRGFDFAKRKRDPEMAPVAIAPSNSEIDQIQDRRSFVSDKGDVYFIRAGGLPYVKIGFCKPGGAEARRYQLQIGCPVDLIILGVRSGGGRALEEELHRRFASNWCRGEWFRLESGLQEFIQSATLDDQ